MTPHTAEAGRGRGSLLVCCSAVFVVMVDGTIVNVALPTVGRDLLAGPSGLQWVIDGYLLMLAAGLLGAGAAGDRFGRRRVLRIGLTAFGLASLAASLAPSLPVLIVTRMLQGLAAAMLPPSSLSLIAHSYPEPTRRAAAMGTWGAVSGLAVACGPLLGGVLVTALGWRSIFWVNAPVVIAALALTSRYLSESVNSRPRRLDLLGLVLGALGLAALTGALITAPTRGWTSTTTATLLGAAAATLAAFVLAQRRRPDPLLPLTHFRSRAFSGAAAIAVLIFFAVNGFTFLTTLYLQNARGETPLRAGLWLLPATAIIMIAAPVSARLTASHGAAAPAIAAAAVMAVGLAGLAGFLDQGAGWLPGAFLCVGIGNGAINPPITTTAVAAMPAHQAGVAAGVTGTARQLGGVLGVAIIGAVFTGHPLSGPALLQPSRLGYAIAAAAAALAALIGVYTFRPGQPRA